MILISVENVTKAFGADDVLSDVSLTLQDDQKMGLVGVNGSGKTTLMRIIAGLDHQDGGRVSIRPELRVGYHAQLGDIDSTATVMEEMLAVFSHVFDMEKRLRDMEVAMGSLHGDPAAFRKLSKDYDRLMSRFESEGGYSYRSSIMGVLNGLSIPQDMHDRSVTLLSGGEKTRVKLAKLLLQRPDVLLLDEPTNHLDLDAIAWLEDYIRGFNGSVIVISHDRYFLDAVTNTTVELFMGRSQQYGGNYSRFLQLRAEVYERQMKEYELQQKEIERQKEIIARFRRYGQEWSVKRAKTRERQLEKMEIKEKPSDESAISFTFEARRRSGTDVLIAEDLSKSYDGRTLFSGLDLHIRAGERVALIGPNGIGKTTLLRILCGKKQSDSGAFMLGANVDMGYYDQQQESISGGKDIINEVWDEFPHMNMTQVRNSLAAFLFVGDEVFKEIDSLSGGERGRVMFTKLMLRGDNFLILDEPTNHLDMDSREVLEEALASFTGTILFVSHDRFFINRIADRVIEMSATGVKEYLGNYDDFISSKKKESQAAEETPFRTKTALREERRRERVEIEKRQSARKAGEELLERIALAEARVQKLEERLADPALYQDGGAVQALSVEYAKEKENLEHIYEEWIEFEESNAEG
ncbi:MAG: ABC-F family ATP-binding cassette domain-containing protein [Christensenellales bacterium]|jgi:ATP-binding cassette subfamily F protein 3